MISIAQAVSADLVTGNGSICTGHYIEWLEEKSLKVAEEVKKRAINYDVLFDLFCDEIPEEYYSKNKYFL